MKGLMTSYKAKMTIAEGSSVARPWIHARHPAPACFYLRRVKEVTTRGPVRSCGPQGPRQDLRRQSIIFQAVSDTGSRETAQGVVFGGGKVIKVWQGCLLSWLLQDVRAIRCLQQGYGIFPSLPTSTMGNRH